MAKPAKKRAKRRDTPRHHVKEWREYRRLSQEQLAERIDRSRGLISQIERGWTELSEDMIYSLADALQCAPWDLFRVDPLKDGDVVDIADTLRGAPSEVQADVLGYARGRVQSTKKTGTDGH